MLSSTRGDIIVGKGGQGVGSHRGGPSASGQAVRGMGATGRKHEENQRENCYSPAFSTVEKVPIFSSIKLINTGKGFFKFKKAE
jgi:hypothetical protein